VSDSDFGGTRPPMFSQQYGYAIDAELRLLAAVQWSIREHGGEP